MTCQGCFENISSWTSNMRGTLSLYNVADLGGAWDIESLSTGKTQVFLGVPRRAALSTG